MKGQSIRNQMAKGLVYIYSGDGQSKTPAALGTAVQAAALGKRVVMVQFLKGRSLKTPEFMHRLEPEIKLFCFEKSVENFEELSEQEKQDEIRNIRNGMNFAKKVLSTGECDLLVLNEVLGLVEKKILDAEELKAILELRGETDVILTGVRLSDDVCVLGDVVTRIETVKHKVWNKA